MTLEEYKVQHGPLSEAEKEQVMRQAIGEFIRSNPKAGFTVTELMRAEFPPPVWIVPGLLTTGLTILAGAPKLGKSWLSLALATAAGSGGTVMGKYQVDKNPALYLALEDTPRRLQDRLQIIRAAPDADVKFFTLWGNGAGALSDLDKYLASNRSVKLVIIDTLAKIRGTNTSGAPQYEIDYSVGAGLKALADKHECAVVAVHHTRKAGAEDYIDAVSGTLGLTGAADTVMVLQRARGEAKASLSVTSRDFNETEIALTFDQELGTWLAIGEGVGCTLSQERRDILTALDHGLPMTTSQIARKVGKKDSAVSNLLSKLMADGLVESPTYGKWRKPPLHTHESSETSESSRDDECSLSSLTPLSPGIQGGTKNIDTLPEVPDDIPLF